MTYKTHIFKMIVLLASLTALGAGCRQRPFGEGGLEDRVLAAVKPRLGVNVRGEWLLYMGKDSDVERWPQHVVVEFEGTKKLLYVRKFTAHTAQLLPISPTTDAWFERASASNKVKLSFDDEIAQLSLSDGVGWFDGARVRWLGPTPSEDMIVARWAKALPTGDVLPRLDEVMRAGYIFTARDGLIREVSAPSQASTIPPGWITVEGALSAAGQARVSSVAPAKPSFPLFEALGVEVFNLATPPAALSSTRVRYGFALQDVARPLLRELLIARVEHRWRVSVSAPTNVTLSADAAQGPSLLLDPIDFNDVNGVEPVALGVFAAFEGWPLYAWQLLGQTQQKATIHDKLAPMSWRRWELMGQAQRSPWMRQALMKGKTHWEAPDLYTQAKAYLAESSFKAAERDARAAIVSFLHWPSPAQHNGVALSELMLARALSGQGNHAQAVAEAAQAAAYHLAAGDVVQAAQAEREAAIFAARGRLWEQAIFYGARARSRFYQQKLPGWCATVELELAQSYERAGQPSQAAKLVSYAQQRFKALNDPVGVNRALLLSASLTQRQDMTLSQLEQLEQSRAAADTLGDKLTTLLASVALAYYRPFESASALDKLRQNAALLMPAAKLSMNEREVIGALALLCAYQPRSARLATHTLAQQRLLVACDEAAAQVRFDEALTQSWIDRAFAALLVDQDATSLIETLRRGVIAQGEPRDGERLATGPQRVLIEVLSHIAHEQPAPSLYLSIKPTLEAHLDPLLRAEALIEIAAQLDERGFSTRAELIWMHAAQLAFEHKQPDQWAQATLEGLSLSDRLLGVVDASWMRQARAQAGQLAIKGATRYKLESFAHVTQAQAASAPDPSLLSEASLEQRLDALLFIAELEQRHQHWDRSGALLLEVRQLEAGAPPALLSSVLGKRLSGRSLVLQAKQAWMHGEVDAIVDAARRAHEILVEDDALEGARLRAQALLWWARFSDNARDDKRIDRELELMSAQRPTRNTSPSMRSWRQVMGWRAISAIAFDRGQLDKSAQAAQWLTAQGYALEDASTLGRGCVRAQLEAISPQAGLDHALRWLKFCQRSKPPQLTRELVELLLVANQRQLSDWAKQPLPQDASAELRWRHQLVTQVMFSQPGPTPQRLARTLSAYASLNERSDPGVRLELGLSLVEDYLSSGALDQARDILVALRTIATSDEPGITLASRLNYQRLRLRYYLWRGRPQDGQPELEALTPEQRAEPEVALMLAELELLQAQAALILGQRQRARGALARAASWGEAHPGLSASLMRRAQHIASITKLRLAP